VSLSEWSGRQGDVEREGELVREREGEKVREREAISRAAAHAHPYGGDAPPPVGGFVTANGHGSGAEGANETRATNGGRFQLLGGAEKGAVDIGGKRRPGKSCLKGVALRGGSHSVAEGGSGVGKEGEEGRKGVRFSMFEGHLCVRFLGLCVCL
jgi:hypothetical protein